MLTVASVRPLLAFVFCTLTFCTMPMPVRAATLFVSPEGSDNNSGTSTAPYSTIQAAVNNANAGDTLTLQAGTYSGNGNYDINFGGKILIVKSASGADKTVIDCGGAHSAFHFSSKGSGAILEGVTIKNSGIFAVSIDRNCSAKLNKCTFSENTNTSVVSDGRVSINECIFTHNSADTFGNRYNAVGEVKGCTFADNKGCVINQGRLSLSDSTFTDNARQIGAVASEGFITLTNCTFSNNIGGGCAVGKSTLTNCKFIGNQGGVGGLSVGTRSTVAGCRFVANTGEMGGGITTNGTVSLTGCFITGNTGSAGGGISNNGTLTLTNCVIASNTATTGNGGGIYNKGQATIRFCTIADNKVKAASTPSIVSQGGAIENDGTAVLTNDILWGNVAPYAAEIGSNGQATTATYCDIQGGLSGTGNIKTDPEFADAANGDLHLQSISPCRHAGVAISATKLVLGVSIDASGHPRPNPPSTGAYEYAK